MSTSFNCRDNVGTALQLLGEYPDGLTSVEMQNMSGIRAANIHNTCRRRKGVYVDRWTINDGGNQWVPVYRLGDEEDAPRPDIRPRVYLSKWRLIRV
jgi:hypothetical protein